MRGQRLKGPAAAPRPAEHARHVLQFLVILADTNPVVWRRIHVLDDCTFWDLHVAIQDAMGWQDYHLHEFVVVHPERRTIDHLGPDAFEPGDVVFDDPRRRWRSAFQSQGSESM